MYTFLHCSEGNYFPFFLYIKQILQLHAIILGIKCLSKAKPMKWLKQKNIGNIFILDVRLEREKEKEKKGKGDNGSEKQKRRKKKKKEPSPHLHQVYCT
jgi:hypothetical protein